MNELMLPTIADAADQVSEIARKLTTPVLLAMADVESISEAVEAVERALLAAGHASPEEVDDLARLHASVGRAMRAIEARSQAIDVVVKAVRESSGAADATYSSRGRRVTALTRPIAAAYI